MNIPVVLHQALAPFTPPDRTPAQHQLDTPLRTPFEIEDRHGLLRVAHPADVAIAVDELVERHIGDVTERVAELSVLRRDRDADEARLDRAA